MPKDEEIRIDIKPRAIKGQKPMIEAKKEGGGEVKLYDLREHKYPSQRGDTFRSLQIFECETCGAVTNSMLMGGYPGYGLRYYCPNSQENWHKELQEMIKLSSQPHPKFYKDELKKEIEGHRKKHKDDVKNDILGNPDFSLKERGVW